MALFIRQNDDRSKLQERLAAELQERNKQPDLKLQEPDTIEKSAFLKDTKDASSLTWLWLVIFVIIAGLIMYFIYSNATQ